MGPEVGTVKHVSSYSYLKENKSDVYCTYNAMLDVILKMCAYIFS